MLFGAASAGCFSDPPAQTEEDDDDDEDDDDEDTASDDDDDVVPTSGDDDDDDDDADTTGDTGADSTSDDGPSDTTDGEDTGEMCGDGMPGAPGCPCDPEPCGPNLECVLGVCSPCGNGKLEMPEQCDGPVDGGTCDACLIVCNEGFADCDGMPDNGCEIDLTSATNCGACGQDCLGGECEEMLCQPVDLALSQSQPLGLDVEGDTIFWTNVVGGTVVSHSINPGGGVTVIATGLTSPETVVADVSKVYWSDTFGVGAGGGGIGRANHDGSELEPEWLSAADTENTRLLLDNATEVFALRITGGVVRASKVFASPVTIATGAAWGGYLDGDMLYWADYGGGQLLRADVSGDGPFDVEVIATGQPNIYGVFVLDDVAYWTVEGDCMAGTGGMVRARAIDALGPVVDIASDLRCPEDLVVDAEHVYWTEWNGAGSVWRSNHDGSDATALFPALSAGITADDTAIYWADQTDGRIRKLAK